MVRGTGGSRSGSSAKTSGRERRFEDISSGDEDDDGNQLAFLRPQTSAAAEKRAPQPPQDRHFFIDDTSNHHNEESEEDGFVFTRAGGPSGTSSSSSRPIISSSSTSSTRASGKEAAAGQRKVPGAKGRPPTSRMQHSSESVMGTATRNNSSSNSNNNIIINDNEGSKRARTEKDAENRNGEHRRHLPSSAIKTARRSSLLKDGRPAYPHPQISDQDLYRHCSGELQPRERMKHLTSWTLERSRQEMKRESASSSSPLTKYRGPLLAALKSTLYDLNRGSIQVDWKGKDREGRGGKQQERASKHLPAHPRNEANRKAEVQLQRSLEEKKKQDREWRQAEAELKSYEAQNERLRAQIGESAAQGDEGKGKGASLFAVASASLTAEENEMLDRSAQAIVLGRHDLLVDDNGNTEGHPTQHIISAAAEHLRQCGLDRLDEEEQDHLGTHHDPRWQDVEFHADLLRAKSHTFAQLSSLSQQYISAVSARGAKALQEMVQGSSLLASSRLDATSDSSAVGRRSRDNLDKILSTIRSIEDEKSAKEEARKRHRANEDAGDVSEGEILRVFAEMS